MEYEVEFNSDDIGEIITIIRVQVLKIHTKPFADKLKITEQVLLSSEEGKGPHGIKILKRLNDIYPNIEVSLNVKIKKEG
jgi:hypothetical protein